MAPAPTPAENKPKYQGLGEGFSTAFEFAVTPCVFAGIGYGVDKLAGTSPWFTIALTIFAVVGTTIKTWYVYNAQMAVEAEMAIAARKAASERAKTRPQVSSAESGIDSLDADERGSLSASMEFTRPVEALA